MAQLLYSLPDAAVAATDLEHRFVLVSPRFSELFGGRLAESIEEFYVHVPLFEASDSARRPVPNDRRPFARAQRGEIVRDLVYLTHCPDGQDRYLRFNAAPRVDVDGKFAGAICLVQDVTAEHLRARREREIGEQLIETINHHFRTPLSLVLGHAELLSDMSVDLPEDMQHSIDALVRGARRLHALTQAVSELVELASATQVSIRSGDIANQVRREIAALERSAKARDVQLRGPRSDEVIISADLRLLRRAFAALLRNAIEHAPPGTCVGISLKRRSGWVEVTVSDRGRGIDSEEAERLCRPFVTLDASGAKHGLGLALAQTVALAHGGSLRLQENPGGGLRASLRIPVDSVVPLRKQLSDQAAYDSIVSDRGGGRRLRVV